MYRSWRSFLYAVVGIRELVCNHTNAKIMFVATLVVASVGVFLNLAISDWCIVVGVTALVWIAEAFNTALELTCDRITTEHDEVIRKAKDVAAGATLIAVLAALFVGITMVYRYALA